MSKVGVDERLIDQDHFIIAQEEAIKFSGLDHEVGAWDVVMQLTSESWLELLHDGPQVATILCKWLEIFATNQKAFA